MTEKSSTGASTWIDPDDALELSADFFAEVEIREGDRLIRPGRGRPRSPDRKQLISLRLDQDVIERFRATGPGWQSRINEELRKGAALLKG